MRMNVMISEVQSIFVADNIRKPVNTNLKGCYILSKNSVEFDFLLTCIPKNLPWNDKTPFETSLYKSRA